MSAENKCDDAEFDEQLRVSTAASVVSGSALLLLRLRMYMARWPIFSPCHTRSVIAIPEQYRGGSIAECGVWSVGKLGS